MDDIQHGLGELAEIGFEEHDLRREELNEAILRVEHRRLRDRVLGFDLGLGCTGWASLRSTQDPEEDVRVRAWGTLAYDKDRDPEDVPLPAEGQRLLWFYERFHDILNKERPLVVAIEDYTLAQARLNPRTLAQAAELGGLLRTACMQHQVPFTLWGPSEWKIYLFGSGNGNVKKERVAELVEEKYEIPTVGLDHNQMEGFCVAMAEWGNRHDAPRKPRVPRRRRVKR